MPSFKRKIFNIANQALGPFGVTLNLKVANPSVFDRLAHMKTLGFSPGVIYDYREKSMALNVW